MKPELFFALENAAWPVLLVEGTGVIRRANEAAVNAFGSTVSGDSTQLSAIWSGENESKPGPFLLRSFTHAVTPLKFLVKGGATSTFLCNISSATREGEKYFLFQLLPGSNLAAPSPVETITLEASLAQKQKLDCALQLTRTVALDFNNTLTSILGHTSLVLSKMETSNPFRVNLLEVEKAAEKAAEIAYDLAAFSWQEKEAHTLKAGNLNELLYGTVELFQTRSASNVLWSLQMENKIYSVNFDEAKMQQVFVKILDNAIQSLGPEGRILVCTRNLDLVEPMQDAVVRLAPGRYVCAEVADSGCGISPEVMPRIFEPFFTTKDPARHRGLGLAWVYGIITNHGGNVAVSSQPAQGTTVRVYLPALKKFIRGGGAKTDDLTGTQTILMVDDEDLLLTMGQMVLSSYGYTVLTTNNGAKALQILNQQSGEIQVLITDMVMPGMSGRELIEHVRRIAPGVRIICSSGYVRPTSNEQSFYLQKPFTSQELLRKVKQILEPPDAS